MLHLKTSSTTKSTWVTSKKIGSKLFCTALNILAYFSLQQQQSTTLQELDLFYTFLLATDTPRMSHYFRQGWSQTVLSQCRVTWKDAREIVFTPVVKKLSRL